MTDKATLSKYLRKVTGDLRDAQRRIGEFEQRAAEPMAVVGWPAAYPGGVDRASGLWELVASGPRHGPGSRRTAAGASDLYRPRPRAARQDYTRRAASSTTPPGSTPGSSASLRARRWRWTRSSGCC